MGVQGVVFGFLQADGQLDWDSNRRLLEAAKEHDLEVVFHRAIDAASDPLLTAAQLQELQFDRVLSAGGVGTILEGSGHSCGCGPSPQSSTGCLVVACVAKM